MPGCRALSQEECAKLIDNGFDWTSPETPVRVFYVRMMLATGLRVSELLTLRLGQIVRFSRSGELPVGPVQALGYIEIARKNLKGGKHAKTTVQNRRIQLGDAANSACVEYVRRLVVTAAEKKKPMPSAVDWAFPSRRGGHLAPRTMVDALAAGFVRAGLAYTADRTLSNHSFRKTYARAAYEASGKDLVVTQKCLGHVRVDRTVQYLDVGREEVARVQSEVSGAMLVETPIWVDPTVELLLEMDICEGPDMC